MRVRAAALARRALSESGSAAPPDLSAEGLSPGFGRLLSAVRTHPRRAELDPLIGANGELDPDFDWEDLPAPPTVAGRWGGADRRPWLLRAMDVATWLAPETWAGEGAAAAGGGAGAAAAGGGAGAAAGGGAGAAEGAEPALGR
jgi:hypothetical protein